MAIREKAEATVIDAAVEEFIDGLSREMYQQRSQSLAAFEAAMAHGGDDPIGGGAGAGKPCACQMV